MRRVVCSCPAPHRNEMKEGCPVHYPRKRVTKRDWLVEMWRLIAGKRDR